MRSLFSQNRLFSLPITLLYIFILCIPMFCALCYFHAKGAKIDQLFEQADLLHKKISRKQNLFKNEEKLLYQISQSDPDYLETVIEPLPLLETERQKWRIFSSHLEMNKAIQDRVHFLEQDKNTLRFSHGEVRKTEQFQEVEATLQNSVELSEEDLKKILYYLENVRIHPFFPQERSPQFIIQSFDLTKKTISETREKIYSLKLKVIKREGTPK